MRVLRWLLTSAWLREKAAETAWWMAVSPTENWSRSIACKHEEMFDHLGFQFQPAWRLRRAEEHIQILLPQYVEEGKKHIQGPKEASCHAQGGAVQASHVSDARALQGMMCGQYIPSLLGIYGGRITHPAFEAAQGIQAPHGGDCCGCWPSQEMSSSEYVQQSNGATLFSKLFIGEKLSGAATALQSKEATELSYHAA